MRQKLRVRPGLLDTMKTSMNLQTDDQFAVVLDVSLDELDHLRAGYPVTWATIMRIAALLGNPFDARGVVELIPATAESVAA